MKIAITGIRGIPANYGGFETCAEETAIRFAREHDVTVYCRKHNTDLNQQVFKGVRLARHGSINTKHFDTISHTFLSAIKIAADRDIQIVHLYNAVNSIFIPLLKAAGKKVIVSVDGIEWKRQKWGPLAKLAHKLSERICGIAADSIIADSRVVQDYYRERLGITTEYIPYGAQIDPEIGPEKLEIFGLTERGYLLFVGRLVPEKGVHNLLAAYKKAEIDLPLVIVGDDSNNVEYKKSLRESAGGKVLFPGYVYGDDYQVLNKYSYAYVSASMLEGTSPALVSAMGAGNCVLVNGIDENLATIGDAGISFNKNDYDDLAAKLKLIARNPDLVEQYRRKALEHVAANFDWDSVSNQYLSLFRRLIGEETIVKTASSAKQKEKLDYESVGRK